MNRKWIYIAIFSVAFGALCENPKTDMDYLFPGAGFEKGWSWHGKPKHFSPNNLFEYIDGEAELYLSYNVNELSTLTYFWGTPEDTFLTVDVYDMGTPINAFGLYSSYRYPEYLFKQIGTEAFVSDFGLKLLKGRYVVEIKSSDNTEKCQNAVLTVAQGIASRIIEPAEFPKIIGMMPGTNQIPHSLRYYAKEMSNQSFLPEGLTAKYRIGGEEVSVFIVIFSNAQSAREGLNKLQAFYRESDGQFVSPAALQHDSFCVKTAYHGYTSVSLAGAMIYGIQDLNAPDRGIPLLLQIKNSITQYSAHQ